MSRPSIARAARMESLEVRRLMSMNNMLSGYVYCDANNDGIKGTGEHGIAGVTVKLSGIDMWKKPVSKALTTDAAGFYRFGDLWPGNYTITEVQPAGHLDGKDRVGSQGGTTGNDVLSNAIIKVGVHGFEGTNNNFGELKPGAISGFVYEDTDDDGVRDDGELAIANVTVLLTGTDDNGTVSRTAVTDTAGKYAFVNLRPGTYSVTEIQPADYLDGKDTLGTRGGTALANDKLGQITLDGCDASQAENYNFGERKVPPVPLVRGMAATIGFWHNKNGQALINSLNGGPTSTALGNYLAVKHPKLYGAQAGTMKLAGKTNAQIAALFLKMKDVQGQKLDAQVLGVALATYVTSKPLAGTAAASFGFIVSDLGTGNALFNIGSAGPAFGVANNAALTVGQILRIANDKAVNGVLWGGNQAHRNLANTVFSGINEKGDRY